jgi:hypothetical protein
MVDLPHTGDEAKIQPPWPESRQSTRFTCVIQKIPTQTHRSAKEINPA